jgi:hypothetical protein
MLTHKEQLVTYMMAGHVHLSKKDYGFFNNLKYLLQDKRPVTSNQDKLFNKLLQKYQRQLTKLGHDINVLEKLDYKQPIVETSQEYLIAKISIENDEITIKSPFNNKFIQYLRNLDNNQFIWSKQEKVYKAEFSTHNLKTAYFSVNKYYDNVRLCPKIQNLIDEIKQYEQMMYWSPTLVKSFNNYYIFGLNQSLYEAIKDIPLNNDPKTLFKLSQYGIKIHPSITKDDSFLRFASEYNTTIDLEQLNDLANWVKELEFDMIYLGSQMLYNKQISTEVKERLKDIHFSRKVEDLDMFTNIVYIHFNRGTNLGKRFHKNIKKMIILSNSRPVQVA